MPRNTTPPENAQPLFEECIHCHSQINPGQASEVEHVCQNCFEEHYARCACCQSYVLYDEAVSLANGDIYCSNCADEYTLTCECCDDVFDRRYENYETAYNGFYICENCADYEYERCDDCGELYPTEDIVDDLCPHCRNHSGGVESYCYKPTPLFHHAPGEPDNELMLGVELEMEEGYVDDTVARIGELYGRDVLYFKRDGSLDNGVELVTHPISAKLMCTDDCFLSMWDEVSRIALECGMRSHDARNCGLHIHVNRSYFGSSAARLSVAELNLLTVADRFFEPLTIFSRRRESELQQWAKQFKLPQSPDGALARARTAHHAAASDRYQAVNLSNRDTIEFRLFKGTLKVDTLMATFQFVTGLCHLAKTCAPIELEKIDWYGFCDRLLNECPVPTEELADYLYNRWLIVQKPESFLPAGPPINLDAQLIEFWKSMEEEVALCA